VRYKIASVHFGERLKRLFVAFERSVLTNCYNCEELTIIEPEPPARVQGIDGSYTDNTHKLHLWREEVERADMPIALLDGDMVVLRDIAPVWAEHGGDWDVAITERPGKYWLNGGAVFCKPTKAAREFMRAWCRVNDDILNDSYARKAALNNHYGINQTALVHMLQYCAPEAKVVKVPCRKWNNCDQTWHQFDDETHILHIKSFLRQHITAYKRKNEWPDYLVPCGEAFAPYDPDAHMMTGFAQIPIRLARATA